MKAPLAAIVALLALIASGCIAGETAGPETRSIADVLGLGDESRTRDLLVRQEILVQSMVQECMISRGFEYVPEDVSAATLFTPQPGADLTDLEYAREWGLGISTYTSYLATDPAGSRPVQVNPNEDHLATLSVQEADAWLLAFDGGVEGFTDNDIFMQSCFYQAAQAVQTSVISEFQDELSRVDERVAQDSRFLEAERAWSQCMNEHGFNFATELAMHQSFSIEVDVLLSSTPDGGEAALGGGPAFDELIERERRAAEASLDCQGDKEQVQAEVRREIEAEFIAGNRGLVDEVIQIGQ